MLLAFSAAGAASADSGVSGAGVAGFSTGGVLAGWESGVAGAACTTSAVSADFFTIKVGLKPVELLPLGLLLTGVRGLFD